MLDDSTLNSLYRYSLSLSNDEAIAYDLVQDALEYYLKITKIIHNPPAYIRKTIRTRYIDLLRKQQRFREEEWSDSSNNALEIDLQSLEKIVIERELLDKIWDKLNSPERELLYLWAVEGYTAQEIANERQVSRGTILSQIHRLRKKLVRFLDQLNVIPITGRNV